MGIYSVRLFEENSDNDRLCQNFSSTNEKLAIDEFERVASKIIELEFVGLPSQQKEEMEHMHEVINSLRKGEAKRETYEFPCFGPARFFVTYKKEKENKIDLTEVIETYEAYKMYRKEK